jgi:hypothetical protein
VALGVERSIVYLLCFYSHFSHSYSASSRLIFRIRILHWSDYAFAGFTLSFALLLARFTLLFRRACSLFLAEPISPVRCSNSAPTGCA